jgi:hypothetical protein
VGRRHKQRLESRLGYAVTEPAPTGAQANPKAGTVSPRRRWVCVFFFFVGYRVIETNRRKKKCSGEKEKTALIPTRVSNMFVQILFSQKREVSYIYIYIQKLRIMGLT